MTMMNCKLIQLHVCNYLEENTCVASYAVKQHNDVDFNHYFTTQVKPVTSSRACQTATGSFKKALT